MGIFKNPFGKNKEDTQSKTTAPDTPSEAAAPAKDNPFEYSPPSSASEDSVPFTREEASPSFGSSPFAVQTDSYTPPQYGAAPPYSQQDSYSPLYQAQQPYGGSAYTSTAQGYQSQPYSPQQGQWYSPQQSYGSAQPDYGSTDPYSDFKFDTDSTPSYSYTPPETLVELEESDSPFADDNEGDSGENADAEMMISELNPENFKTFADKNFDDIFAYAYSGSRREKHSLDICCSVLARLLSFEAYAENAGQTPVSAAIMNCYPGFMTKKERREADEHLLTLGQIKDPPPFMDRKRCIEKAYDKGVRDIPRYAPVFTGTVGASVVVLIVAAIIAVTVLIWLQPLGSKKVSSDSDLGGGLSEVYVNPMSSLNSHFLIQMGAHKLTQSPRDELFNTGVLPVSLELEGPDVVSLSDIRVFSPSGDGLSVYQYATASYCFFSDTNGNYRIEANDSELHAAHEYVRVSGLEAAESDIKPLYGYFAVAHDRETVLPLFDAEDFNSSGDSVYVNVLPENGSLTLSSDMLSATFTSGSTLGLDSFTLQLYNSASAQTVDLVFPILIYNSAPKADPAFLKTELAHTPNTRGINAGYLSASDADGDEIFFELTDCENCSVMLAPNGGYICMVEKNCTEDSASFGFTVSDGLISSVEYRRVFNLKNNLLNSNSYTQDFVCYSGEDAWYTLELPTIDTDGDALRWRVISSLESGLTEYGSAVKVSSDGSTVSYRLDPHLDEDFSETIVLICTDGWDSSDAISFICNVSSNHPPVAAAGNSGSVASGGSSVFTLKLDDDCAFDKLSDCRILRVDDIEGGRIADSTGWPDLMFTFTHDGESESCYAVLVVEDRLTGKTSNIRFAISVK